MPEQHPKLTAALAVDDYGALIGIALRARLAADEEGRYCKCAEPLVLGLDLMCAACLLNNRDQEKRRLISLYGAHDFEPDESKAGSFMGWCKCTYPEDDPRHHGVDVPSLTSWGEQLVPPYDDLRRSLDG